MSSSVSPSPSPGAVPWNLASTLTITKGAISTGSLADTYTDNNVFLVLTETPGAPGFTYDFIFGDDEAVTTTLLDLHIRGYYQGGSGHTVTVQQYNYSTLAYTTLGTISSGVAEQSYHFVPVNAAAYLSGGQITIRFTHTATGNPSHLLRIDSMHLEAPGSPSQSPSLSPSGSSSPSASASPSTAADGIIHLSMWERATAFTIKSSGA